ncbi:MAG: aspartate/glutamate racemase family protein [Desulfobacterota bacterium]|nr:aspartate/glutamate racemase family protein [Thermodesulfobacteriota bacterium]
MKMNSEVVDSGRPSLGIILLDTLFPRPIGDVGNPGTFPFPVLYEVVKGAIPSRVVQGRDSSLLPPFIEAARRLVERGAKAITTSCGFLALFQRELSTAVPIPVFTSSLVQIPWAYELVGRRGRIGVLTADPQALGIDHLQSVGAEGTPVVIGGMDPEGEFYETYVRNRPRADFGKVEGEIVAKLEEMLRDHPDLSALVLECTNMALYRRALRKIFDRPIFDILTLIHYLHSSLK